MIHKLATETVGALRTQPLALALILMNILFLTVGGFTLKQVGDAIVSEREARNVLLTQILAKCGS